MRTLNIPSIGDVVTLARDWTFTCIAEYRNEKMMDYLKESGAIPPDSPMYEPEPTLCGAEYEVRYRATPAGIFGPGRPERVVVQQCRLLPGHDIAHGNAHYPRDYCRYACTIPAGVQLRVDRIYIRKGKKDYDSFTFWALGLGKKRVRFFARLDDVNQMVVSDDPSDIKGSVAQPIRAILIREEETV